MPTAFDRDGFNRVVSMAGLTKSELAALYDTTRQTIYNWINGGEPTNKVLIRAYNKITDKLLRAVVKKILPFNVNLSRQERGERIEAMLKVLHGPK